MCVCMLLHINGFIIYSSELFPLRLVLVGGVCVCIDCRLCGGIQGEMFVNQAAGVRTDRQNDCLSLSRWLTLSLSLTMKV